MPVLKLRGGLALSPFRLDKLNARVADALPGASVVATCYWHFVETDAPLTGDAEAVLRSAADLRRARTSRAPCPR